jgi:hypothetical protein
MVPLHHNKFKNILSRSHKCVQSTITIQKKKTKTKNKKQKLYSSSDDESNYINWCAKSTNSQMMAATTFSKFRISK